MTTTDDVIRQVETTLTDTLYPPTFKQKEMLTMILYQVGMDTAAAERSR
jgi:hypothetical protein